MHALFARFMFSILSGYFCYEFDYRPLWNETIERLFSAKYDNVKKCLSLLWNDYCNEFPDYVNPDDNEDFLH